MHACTHVQYTRSHTPWGQRWTPELNSHYTTQRAIWVYPCFVNLVFPACRDGYRERGTERGRGRRSRERERERKRERESEREGERDGNVNNGTYALWSRQTKALMTPHLPLSRFLASSLPRSRCLLNLSASQRPSPPNPNPKLPFTPKPQPQNPNAVAPHPLHMNAREHAHKHPHAHVAA